MRPVVPHMYVHMWYNWTCRTHGHNIIISHIPSIQIVSNGLLLGDRHVTKESCREGKGGGFQSDSALGRQDSGGGDTAICSCFHQTGSLVWERDPYYAVPLVGGVAYSTYGYQMVWKTCLRRCRSTCCGLVLVAVQAASKGLRIN